MTGGQAASFLPPV